MPKVLRSYVSGFKGSSTNLNQHRSVEGQKCQLLTDT
jgi:hypothetical protein